MWCDHYQNPVNILCLMTEIMDTQVKYAIIRHIISERHFEDFVRPSAEVHLEHKVSMTNKTVSSLYTNHIYVSKATTVFIIYLVEMMARGSTRGLP